MSFPPPNSPHVRPKAASGPPAAFYVPRPLPPPAVRWALRASICGGIVVACAVMLLVLHVRFLPGAFVLPGLRIDGEALAPEIDAGTLRVWLDARAKALEGQKIELALHDAPQRVATLAELGVRVDVASTLDVAARLGKEGDLWSRALVAREARAGLIDVPLRVVIDREAAMAVVTALKEKLDTEAVSARLDLEKHATIPERDGRYIDADATLARIDTLARSATPGARAEAARVELPVVTFAPRISAATLADLDISTVLAEYETHFSRAGDQKQRGKNIDNAAQKLDGLVLSPGELVSFNTVIGERSETNGFQKSWEIFKGEMVEGVGGGTCQVASTLHAALFFGGFEILERLPHSRPSAYIPMGLDSTVVYPEVDLKVRNPHPFPIVVHAKTEGSKLRVELLGKMRPVHVSFGRELLKTVAYSRKIVEEPSLSGKKVLVKQHGIKGYRIKRSRLLKYPDGTSKKEDHTDYYPPTTEIYHVPVGFDVALLPPLPAAPEGQDTDAPAASAGVAASQAASSATPSVENSRPSSSSALVPANVSPGSGPMAAECATCTKPADGVELVDAPGAHAPNAAQKDPAKTVWMKR